MQVAREPGRAAHAPVVPRRRRTTAAAPAAPNSTTIAAGATQAGSPPPSGSAGSADVVTVSSGLSLGDSDGSADGDGSAERDFFLLSPGLGFFDGFALADADSVGDSEVCCDGWPDGGADELDGWWLGDFVGDGVGVGVAVGCGAGVKPGVDRVELPFHENAT